MNITRAAIVWIALALAAVASLGAARLIGTPPNPEDSIAVRVSGTASRDGDTVTYTFTLASQADYDLGDIFVAGKVPPGVTFAGAESTPAGTRFRGYEADGTPLQAAVWVAETLSARSTVGPFSYRVRVNPNADARTQVWVRWIHPTEGNAISLDLVPPPEYLVRPHSGH